MVPAAPDGSLKFAENPPKRYQDIHNLDWDTTTARASGRRSATSCSRWCDAGVTVFRVDNPHTKPVPFWEWLIAEVRRRYPETMFLSEAFTRPAMMTLLAKAGFSQSYTYFTWKNSKAELVELVEQLRVVVGVPPAEPLAEHARHPSRATCSRAAAPPSSAGSSSPRRSRRATGSTPATRRCENVPVRAGSEEYLDSEKYEVRERRARRAAPPARPAAQRDPAGAPGAHRQRGSSG